MADRTPGRTGRPDGAGLEAMLVDLGRHLDLPAGADPAPAVLARLAAAEPPPTPLRPLLRRLLRRRVLPRWRPPRAAVAAALAAALLVAVTPAGQAAVSRVVHAFGVVLRLGTPGAPDRPEQLPGETRVTGPTSVALERARAQVRFRVVAPTALGVPDQVLVSDGGRVVSLVYRAGPGRPPAGAGGVSARLDEFEGTVDPVFYKTLGEEAQFLELPAGGSAVWIGKPHDVVYVGADRKPRTGSAHLASRTLIWELGGVTLRLEGAFSQEQAVAVATEATATGPTPGASR